MRVTTDEQLQEIWQRASDDNVYADVTIDQWGNEMTIFEGWSDVEKIAQVGYSVLPREFVAEHKPSWPHLSYPVDPDHHIEWMIGDFGFSDQYQTCSHCRVAIDTHDIMPRYYFNQDIGELTCRECVKKDFADEYLAYCAAHLADEQQEIARSWIGPIDYGYIPINAYSITGGYSHAYDTLSTELGIDELVDHPSWPNGLTYGTPEEIKRLGKAVQLIDDKIMIVAQWYRYGGSILFWAKWEDSSDYHPDEIDPAISRAILDYAIGRILAKYQTLSAKATVRGK